MMRTEARPGAVALVALLAAGSIEAAGPPPARVIGQTIVVGETDPAVWTYVLDVLPARPRRIEVLDLESLSATARQKVEGRDAFVLAGQTTIVVIRQGATLRQAELEGGLARLALASLVWHEMAHAKGLRERAALQEEQALWQRFISTGLVNSAAGMSYVAGLREVIALTSESGPEPTVAALGRKRPERF